MKKEFNLESKGLKVLQGGYLFPQALCQALLRHEKIKVYIDHCFENTYKNKEHTAMKFILGCLNLFLTTLQRLINRMLSNKITNGSIERDTKILSISKPDIRYPTFYFE